MPPGAVLVTINRAARGIRGFNPDYIDITWKMAT
jgi:hypothetical protein